MSQGWVSIHRQIKQHWLWTTDKPFDKRSAWIDLVLSANHTGNKFVLGTQLVTVQKGEFITSELKLMERWGWGKTKLRNFLKLLEDDGMITKKSTNKQTTITIVNYCLYQEPQTTDDTSDKPQANHRQTADVQQTYTNNNVLIMSNNENKKDIPKNIIEEYTKNEKLRSTLKEFISMRKKIKAGMTDYALKLMLAKLDRLSNGSDVMKVKILEQSIMSNYKGIFAIKDGAENGTGGKHSTEAKNVSKWGNLEGIIHL